MVYKILTNIVYGGLKRADLRWNRNLKDLEELTYLQDALLDAASL